jgi:hypothetical protein
MTSKMTYKVAKLLKGVINAMYGDLINVFEFILSHNEIS